MLRSNTVATSVAVAGATFTLLLAGCATPGAEPAGASDSTDAETPQWLMVTNGESATIADGVFTLTGVDDDTLAFTDRPNRDADQWDTEEFLGGWEESFSESAPNVAVKADGFESAATFSNFRYEGENAVWDVTVLEGQNAFPGELNDVHLFIDPITRWPCLMYPPGQISPCPANGR